MYCDTCGKMLPFSIGEYGSRAESYRKVECSTCRHTPQRATDLLAELSRRQTVKV